MTFDEAVKDLQERPAFAVFMQEVKRAREAGFFVLQDTSIQPNEVYHILGSMSAYGKILEDGKGEEVMKRWENFRG